MVTKAQPTLVDEIPTATGSTGTAGALMAPRSMDALAMFERFATDPNASVEKIERLMALWERGEAKKAEIAFNAAMSAAQAEMRSVATDAINPETHSRYASYEALDRALRPIYTKYGFGLTFDTADCPTAEHVRVICAVVHRDGHSKPYRIDMPADGKGAKGGAFMSKTHAAASAISYGMRYLLRMIWNIATAEGDDDGNAAGTTDDPAQADPSAPKGFDIWWSDMQTVAKQGQRALFAAWNASDDRYRKYLMAAKAGQRAWQELKAQAGRVQS